MPRPSAARVRFAIVGVFAALGCGFLASPGGAQPGTPGFPTRPNFPPRPEIPRPGFGGLPGAGMPGVPGPVGGPGGLGGGLPTYSWTCGKCKASLGTTNTPINPHVRCPHCGVIFTSTKIENGPPGAMPNPGFGGPPAVVPPPGTPPTGAPGEPTLPTNPAFANPMPGSAPPAEPVAGSPPAGAPPVATPPAGGSTAGDATAPAPTSDAPSEGKSKLKLIGIVVGVILLFGALAALGVAVSNASASKPIKRKKKPRFDDDD